MDHKPTDKEETRRIYNFGGFVRYGRVNGNLALSRAFGDFALKDHSNGNFFNRIYKQLEQPVIAKPTVTILPKAKSDQILVLGRVVIIKF